MRRLIGYAAVAIAGLALGLMLGQTELGAGAAEQLRDVRSRALHAAVGAVADASDMDMRTRVLMENPELLAAIERGGAFGGQHSIQVAQNMFSRDPDAIADAIDKMEMVEVGPRSWLIRLPIVNAVAFETDAGWVLVDTGMGPAGPAVLKALRDVSDAPVHTIVYTHGHVDHAYGTWAIVEAGETPEIVAHEAIVPRFDRYIRLRGSIARYMSQPEDQLPATRADIVWPTQVFDDRLELEIGGETFVLQHHRGETDDQLYVWVPGRNALASADYYQGFLPNAGNGKRVQRHIEDWAVALREMAALEPQILLPAHGAEIIDPATIQENFLVLAEVFDDVMAHTVAGLNSGLRKDQVSGTYELPAHLAEHPSLNIQYVTPQDISKMVIKQYTGWWDDVPSNWTPAPLDEQAQAIVALAGGMEALDAHARELLERDVQLASHFADWAWIADPRDPLAQALVIDVYKARILDPRSNTQEILAYVDAMTEARAAQLGIRPEDEIEIEPDEDR